MLSPAEYLSNAEPEKISNREYLDAFIAGEFGDLAEMTDDEIDAALDEIDAWRVPGGYMILT